MPWPEYDKVRWSPRGTQCPAPERSGVWSSNTDLHKFLIDLSGRYLAGARGDLHSPIDFSYCLFVQRGQSEGFLRLDIDGLSVVAGYERSRTNPELVSQVALRYASLPTDGAISFLPLITVGATERFAYYITGPSALVTIHPDLIRAALRFTAEYLVLPACRGDRDAAASYAKAIERGTDPGKALDIEPLLGRLIGAAPAETRANARSEYARGLEAMLRGQL